MDDRAVPDDEHAAERHPEVETKLDVDAGFALPAMDRDPAVRAAGVVAATEPVVHGLDATYYDTDRLDLLRSRLTLRRRTGGTDAGWHLKLPAGAGARTEVRVPLPGNGSGSDEVPGQLADLVVGAARGRALVAVARVSTRRTAVHLLDGDGTAVTEVADDEVTGAGLLPDGPVEQRWREVEVELEDGSPEVVTAVVRSLLAAGARPAGAASKLGRLLGVAGDAGSGAETGSGERMAPAESGGSVRSAGPSGSVGSARPAAPTAGDAIVAYLSRQRELLTASDIRLRAPDPDPEAPHDARAAARRIRSVLRVYRPLLVGQSAGSVAARLQRFGRAVSEVRDLDVALLRMARLGAGTKTGLGGRLADRRASALAALRVVLASDEYLGLLRDLDALVAGPPLALAAGCPAEAVLAPLLAAAWLDLRADAEIALASSGPVDRPAVGAGDAPVTSRPLDDGAALVHRVRKDAKTVRYAADAAAGSGGSDAGGSGAGGGLRDAMVAFSGEVELLQDVLGAHQDAVASAALVESLLGSPGDSPAGPATGPPVEPSSGSRQGPTPETSPADTDLTDADRAVLRRWGRAEADERERTRAAFADLWPRLPLLPPG